MLQLDGVRPCLDHNWPFLSAMPLRMCNMGPAEWPRGLRSDLSYCLLGDNGMESWDNSDDNAKG